MDLINILTTTFVRFLPLLATLALVTFLLVFLNRHFRKRWQNNPDLQFRFQLIMLVLTMAGERRAAGRARGPRPPRGGS